MNSWALGWSRDQSNWMKLSKWHVLYIMITYSYTIITYSYLTCYYLLLLFFYYSVITSLLRTVTSIIFTHYYFFCYRTTITSLLRIITSTNITYNDFYCYYTPFTSLLCIITLLPLLSIITCYQLTQAGPLQQSMQTNFTKSDCKAVWFKLFQLRSKSMQKLEIKHECPVFFGDKLGSLKG